MASRSAYFRLGRMLRENIPCRAVLALTATATKATEASMVDALGIIPSAVFRDASLRENLRFHVHHTNGGPHPQTYFCVLLNLADCNKSLPETVSQYSGLGFVSLTIQA